MCFWFVSHIHICELMACNTQQSLGQTVSVISLMQIIGTKDERAYFVNTHVQIVCVSMNDPCVYMCARVSSCLLPVTACLF